MIGAWRGKSQRSMGPPADFWNPTGPACGHRRAGRGRRHRRRRYRKGVDELTWVGHRRRWPRPPTDAAG